MAYLVELTQPRTVSIRTYPTPPIGPGEVRVRTLYSGISAGTELSMYRGTNPYLAKQWDPDLALFQAGRATFSYPVDAWGYSEVGVVDAVGPEAAGLSVGDTVWGIWGHRSHAVLPVAGLAGHVMSADLDPLVGCFNRVGAVALNAVLAAEARIGEAVAVFGQGVIGLLATQLLTSQGIEVLAIDTNPSRLALARSFGATPFTAGPEDLALTLREHTGDRGPDRVIELTGAYPALHEAIRSAGVGGTVVAAGFYQGPATALDLGEEFHHNRVTLTCSQIGSVPASLRERWTRERLHETVARLCAAGRIDPMPLVSHVLPATDAAAAYALLDQPPGDLLQVVLDFKEDAA
jgi:2-desacetyl-2-hydroxyethyl bacteriochlorophyllide A dehydrogenase